MKTDLETTRRYRFCVPERVQYKTGLDAQRPHFSGMFPALRSRYYAATRGKQMGRHVHVTQPGVLQSQFALRRQAPCLTVQMRHVSKAGRWPSSRSFGM